MNRIRKFLFTNTTLRQTLLKNTFWLAASTTVSRIIRSIVIIFAARLLGTEHYGFFTYAMSLAALFTIFADVGLSGLLTRELAKRSEKDEFYISTLSFTKLALIICSTLLIIIFGPLIAKFDEAKPLLVIIALLLAFDGLRSFIYSIIRSRNQMQSEAGFELATEACLTAFCLGALLIKPTALALAIGYMVGSGAGFLILAVSFRKSITRIFSRIKRQLIIPILSTTLPFAIVGIFNVLMTNIDSVIIGVWNSAETLGLYGAAQRPMSLLYLLPGFLGTSLFPIMSTLVKEGNTAQAQVLVRKAVLASILLATPIVLGGLLIAKPFINAIFGYSYVGAVPTFKILLVTLLPIFPGIIFYYLLFAENRQKVFIVSSGIGAIINIALDFLFIPRYGIAGSAVATLCVQLVVNTILFRAVRKHYVFNIKKEITKMFVALASMGTAVLALLSWSTPLLVIIPVGIIVYVGVLILLKTEFIIDIKKSFVA
ncbi:MAG TPA: flippase [Candidatus Paceibacterota bacterium]|nr:flippase [Candidatus Paceibacterota bacterium]